MLKHLNKLTALIIALAAVMTSGCGSSTPAQPSAAVTDKAPARTAQSESTEDEEAKRIAAAKAYFDSLKEAFQGYSEANRALTDAMEAEKYDDAEASLDNMESSLTKLGDISAPPEYASDQSRLKGCLRPEFDYVDLCRKFIGYCKKGDSLTEDDRIEVEAITHEIELTSTDFTDILLDIVKKVKADISK